MEDADGSAAGGSGANAAGAGDGVKGGVAHDDAKTNDAKMMDADGSESDDSAASESSEAPDIGLDQHGRIAPGVQGPANYGFRCLADCVAQRAGLLEDCAAVFSARQAEDDEAYSAGETYFVRADADADADAYPSGPGLSALEELALSVFRFHAAGLDFDAANSGAEWWTLVLDDDSDVAFHWDKDYHVEEYGINVFPNISTVTYLADAGGATLVLEKTAPPPTGAPFAGPAGPLAMCSKPRRGKHVSFDGRMLHCASSDFLPLFEPGQPGRTQPPRPPQGPRVTFLVNVWFNHVPRDAEPLPAQVRSRLQLPRDARLWAAAPREVSLQPLPCLGAGAASDGASASASVAEALQRFDMKFGDDEAPHAVRFALPRVATPNTDTVVFQFSEHTAPTVHSLGSRAPEIPESQQNPNSAKTT